MAVKSGFPIRLLTLIEKSLLGTTKPGLIERSDVFFNMIGKSLIIGSVFISPLSRYSVSCILKV